MVSITVAGMSRGYEGLRHSALSTPRLSPPSLNVKTWDNLPPKEVESIYGDKVRLRADPINFFDLTQEGDTFVTHGIHALPLMRTLDPEYASSVDIAPLELIVDYLRIGLSLADLMRECRDSFHHRVSSLVTKRAPRQAIELILACSASLMDWNETKLNQAASTAMYAVPGNPYNVECDEGVNRQTALIWLYFGPLYEQNRLASRPSCQTT